MCNSKKPYLVRCSTCTARKGYLAYISGYFFSLIMTMHDIPLYALKKNIHRSWKAKRIKMLLNMVASIFLGVWELYDVPQKWWSPSNNYDCVWMYLILLYHYLHMMRHLCFLAKVSHTTCILFTTFDILYRYNVIWPSQGIHVIV